MELVYLHSGSEGVELELLEVRDVVRLGGRTSLLGREGQTW